MPFDCGFNCDFSDCNTKDDQFKPFANSPSNCDFVTVLKSQCTVTKGLSGKSVVCPVTEVCLDTNDILDPVDWCFCGTSVNLSGLSVSLDTTELCDCITEGVSGLDINVTNNVDLSGLSVSLDTTELCDCITEGISGLDLPAPIVNVDLSGVTFDITNDVIITGVEVAAPIVNVTVSGASNPFDYEATTVVDASGNVSPAWVRFNTSTGAQIVVDISGNVLTGVTEVLPGNEFITGIT